MRHFSLIFLLPQISKVTTFIEPPYACVRILQWKYQSTKVFTSDNYTLWNINDLHGVERIKHVTNSCSLSIRIIFDIISFVRAIIIGSILINSKLFLVVKMSVFSFFFRFNGRTRVQISDVLRYRCDESKLFARITRRKRFPVRNDNSLANTIRLCRDSVRSLSGHQTWFHLR